MTAGSLALLGGGFAALTELGVGEHFCWQQTWETEVGGEAALSV